MKKAGRNQNQVELFDFVPETMERGRAKKSHWRQVRRARAQALAAVRAGQNRGEDELAFPPRSFGPGGERRAKSLHGLKTLKITGVDTTAHAAATGYPFVAGPSLGAEGIYLGRDLHGGGAFCFDPWSLYRQGVISGMSAMFFGQVGTGKSSLAKSFAIRSVLAGRKLSVASDKKGEWTIVVRALGGSVIQIGPGMGTRLNPLDPGTRPGLDTDGKPLMDQGWAMMVRTRRMAILVTLAKILTGRDLEPAEHYVLSTALDRAEGAAESQHRVVVIPDVLMSLDQMRKEEDQYASEAASVMWMTLQRIVSGDLAGMFDGPSTVDFDRDAPAVSIDTSSLNGASPEAARVVNACAGAWTEAMVTTSDGGQRLVIYEEGWDNISSEADLRRMVEAWKLARAYGIFNILIMHKVSDLDMAGDQGSKMAAMAKSLLADADVKVIYRQDASALRITTDEMELSDRERALIKTLPKGTGLWRLGNSSFEVKNDLTRAEIPLFDTDARMDMIA